MIRHCGPKWWTEEQSDSTSATCENFKMCPLGLTDQKVDACSVYLRWDEMYMDGFIAGHSVHKSLKVHSINAVPNKLSHQSPPLFTSLLLALFMPLPLYPITKLGFQFSLLSRYGSQKSSNRSSLCIHAIIMYVQRQICLIHQLISLSYCLISLSLIFSLLYIYVWL